MHRVGAALLLTLLLLFPVLAGAQALTDVAISSNSTGDITVVAAVAGKEIHVYRLVLVVDADTVLTFKDGASTNLTGAMSMLGEGSIVLDYDGAPKAWFATSSGNAFVINQTWTAQVSGKVSYVLR